MDKRLLIIILILISIYFIFYRVQENLSLCGNDGFNLDNNPIVIELGKLLQKNKLSTRVISRIISFDSRFFEDDKSITLSELFSNDKIPSNIQNEILKNINDLVNSYRLENISKDFVINLDNTVAEVKHLFLKNMVVNSVICLPNKPDDISQFWGLIVDMLIKPSGYKCTDEDFLKYLYFKENFKTIEPFFGNMGGDDINFNLGDSTNMIDTGVTIKDDEKKEDLTFGFYKNLNRIKLTEDGEFIISFDKHFLNFGPEIVGGKFKKEMDILFDKFSEKNNRSLNHESEEDMKRLLDIYEEEFNSLINLIKKTKSDPTLEKKFKQMKELYPYLKQNLLLGRVNKYLKSKRSPERAFRCLSTDNKICVNDINKIFGTEDIGFVSKSTCIDTEVNKFSDSSLDDILKIHQFWSKSSAEDKKLIFDKLRIMLDYHKVTVPENFGVIKLKELKIKLFRQANIWKGENIEQKDNEVYKKLEKIPDLVDKTVKDADLKKILVEIVNKMDFSQRLVWNELMRKPNFKLSASLIKYFIYGLELEKIFNINAVQMQMNLGLPSKKSFYDIIIEYQVPIKYIKYIWKAMGNYIPQFITNDINDVIDSVFYNDEFFVKNSYYVSYLASICHNKEEVFKRIENNLGEEMTLMELENTKKFISQQCKNN